MINPLKKQIYSKSLIVYVIPILTVEKRVIIPTPDPVIVILTSLSPCLATAACLPGTVWPRQCSCLVPCPSNADVFKGVLTMADSLLHYQLILYFLSREIVMLNSGGRELSGEHSWTEKQGQSCCLEDCILMVKEYRHLSGRPMRPK